LLVGHFGHIYGQGNTGGGSLRKVAGIQPVAHPHLPELRYKFAAEVVSTSQRLTYYYRTGDRGCVDPDYNGALRIIGRIVGEEGMVKINGVRVELGEIESALVDDLDLTADTDSAPVVISCLAKVLPREDRSEIHASCVLSDAALNELGITSSKDKLPKPGMLIRGGAILPLLRARCVQMVKAACIPTAFVIIPSLPISPAGKQGSQQLLTLVWLENEYV
jgi:acyl-CoA synthetase (AMP-forming)/AMP-acid ligase II